MARSFNYGSGWMGTINSGLSRRLEAAPARPANKLVRQRDVSLPLSTLQPKPLWTYRTPWDGFIGTATFNKAKKVCADRGARNRKSFEMGDRNGQEWRRNRMADRLLNDYL